MDNNNLFCRLNEIDERLSKINKTIDLLNIEKQELLQTKENITKQLKSESSKKLINYETAEFSWSAKVNNLLKSQFNLKKFRSLQLKTINVTLDNNDCILIKPTGGGKSLCYQIPACIYGITVVISPLVSLIQDQVLSCEKFGLKCISLDASCPLKTQNLVYKCMEHDTPDCVTYNVIFVTPEKIGKSKKFMKSLEKAYADKRLARIVIDEIHCASEYGHDFRTDYQKLHIFKSQFSKIPLLGLTATASELVVNDIRKMLNLPYNCLVFRDNYNRPNLFYEVHHMYGLADKSNEIRQIIQERFATQSGIVYAYSQKDCEELSAELISYGIKAAFYHANLPYDQRQEIHNKWLSEHYKVLVATIAFGMGIDKPNVRFVLHASMSRSLENYYQESGRAGRDNQSSYCILLWQLNDFLRLSGNVFVEKCGLQHLQSINEYALDLVQCKRIYLAGIFNNQYQPGDCTKQCCTCAPSPKTKLVDVDIRSLHNEFNKIIEKAMHSNNPNVTASKLMGQLDRVFMQSLASKLGKLHAQQSRSVYLHLFVELALAYLLQLDYLKLDYHFGSFKNFVYIRQTNKSLGPDQQIIMKMRIFVGSDKSQALIGPNSNLVSDDKIVKHKKISQNDLKRKCPKNEEEDDFVY